MRVYLRLPTSADELQFLTLAGESHALHHPWTTGAWPVAKNNGGRWAQVTSLFGVDFDPVRAS